jgi:polyphosphate glucokinase
MDHPLQAAASPAISAPDRVAPDPITLGIDIGGSHIKAALVAPNGGLLTNYERVVTPIGRPPAAIVETISALVGPLGGFDRVSVGFPGATRGGTVLTAPNLGNDGWDGFRLVEHLASRLARPVRLANDATVQGLGAISGRGLECAITLGTGMGFALFMDGQPAPHLEMGQHNAHKQRSYDHYVGAAAMDRDGAKKWNKHVLRSIDALRILVNFDLLYIGGGNATAITFSLPPDVHLVSNETGITGGVRLWDGVFNRHA